MYISRSEQQPPDTQHVYVYFYVYFYVYAS
jgi:hypothetical protein